MGEKELLQTLEIVDLIARNPGEISSETLMRTFFISVRTLKRRLALARELGVVFVSDGVRGKRDESYVWTITNADEIRHSGRLRKWLELEREGSLVAVKPDFYLCVKTKEAGAKQLGIQIIRETQPIFESSMPFEQAQTDNLKALLDGKILACDMHSFDCYQVRAELGKSKVECRFVHWEEVSEHQ